MIVLEESGGLVERRGKKVSILFVWIAPKNFAILSCLCYCMIDRPDDRKNVSELDNKSSKQFLGNFQDVLHDKH